MKTVRRAVAALFTLALTLSAGCGGGGTAPNTNRPPTLIDVLARPGAVVFGGSSQVTALASDPDNQTLTYRWSATAGTFADSSASRTRWTAPDVPGNYVLSLFVTDQTDTTTGTVSVAVGEASLTVLSDPPGAAITLNGQPSGSVTPHTFNPLAPGFHQVSVNNVYWTYESPMGITDLQHGEADTLTFISATPFSEALRITGNQPNDFLEIGGLDFLPDGSGIVFAGRKAGGTGLYTASINPQTGEANGLLLLSGVRLEEPVSISAEGPRVFFVDDEDSLKVARLVDGDADGVVEEVAEVLGLRDNTFGPAVSSGGWLAFGELPSNDPPLLQLFWAPVQDSALGATSLATTTAARLPSWKPGDTSLAYERNGVIFTTVVVEGAVLAGDTLAAQGFNTAPDWGPYGPTHVAMLRGTDEASLSQVVLAARGSASEVWAAENLDDPRFIAWSPTLRALAVVHHPAGVPEVRFISGLPVP